MSNEEKKWNYERILGRLLDVRSNEETASLLRGVLLAAAIILSIVILSFAAEAVFHFGTGVRTALFLLLALTVLGSFAAFAGPPLLKRMNLGPRKQYDDIAQYFEDLIFFQQSDRDYNKYLRVPSL